MIHNGIHSEPNRGRGCYTYNVKVGSIKACRSVCKRKNCDPGNVPRRSHNTLILKPTHFKAFALL